MYIKETLNMKISYFVLVGIVTTLTDIVIFTSFIYLFGKSYENIIIFGIISYSIVILFSFILNGKLTFKDRYLSNKKFIIYYISASMGMLFNILIVMILMIDIGLGTIISKIIAACIIVFYNYTVSKKYIFVSKS